MKPKDIEIDALVGRIIVAFDVFPEFEWPESKEALKTFFKPVDTKLYSDKVVQRKTKKRKSCIAILSIDFTPTLQNLHTFIKKVSEHCFLGDMDDMYFLASMAHEKPSEEELAKSLKTLLIAPGSIAEGRTMKVTPCMSENIANDYNLKAGVKNIEDSWDFDWKLIVHFTKPYVKV